MRSHLPLLLLVAAFGAAVPACSAAPDEDESEEALAAKLSATTIKSAAAYKSFSVEGGGLGGAGRSMKFLIDARTPNARAVYFVNGNYKVGGKVPDYAKYHYFFARKELGVALDNESFNDATYFTQKKKFFAGTIQTYVIGNDTAPTYAVQLYPDDVAAEATILAALATIKPAFTIPSAKLAFVATGPQQTTASVKAAIAQLGYKVMSIEEILGSVKYFPVNTGEAWGHLRIFPADTGELRPTDIPVFDELPLDLSVVAGTITRVYQDATSHINLKSKERGTPNMVLRDASTMHARLAPFANKPVHLVVGKVDFTIEPSTDQIVKAKLAERLSKPWIKLPLTAETKLASYDEMCPSTPAGCLDLVPRYGGKASGLGFLVQRSVIGRRSQPGSVSNGIGYDLVPFGFAAPVQGYRDFVADPANAVLKSKIASLVAAERAVSLSPNERATRVKEIQGLFLTGRLDPARLTQVNARLAQILPGVAKVKVRSSSNAEDVPNFDGAGLYDSFSAEPANADNQDGSCVVVPDADTPTKSKVSPKTVQCAIKAVYASLWNVRAVDERSFARLDHETSGMGLAIVPAYDTDSDIAANAVVITRVVNSDIIGYTVAVQKGNNLVTNPEPGTMAETDVATFGGFNRPARFTVTRYATPTKGQPALTAPVLQTAQLEKLVGVVKAAEIAYCKASPDYYDGDCNYVWLDPEKPKSLDLEIKVLETGHFIVKQSREFHGK